MKKELFGTTASGKSVFAYTIENKPDFGGGIQRIRRGAVCLETQTEFGAISRGEIFYDKGEVYKHRSVYSVKVRKEG